MLVPAEVIQDLPKLDVTRMHKVKENTAMNKEPSGDLQETIAELQRIYPNWRLGQLIANIAGWADQEIWDVEDEQLLAAAQSHLRQRGSCEVESSGTKICTPVQNKVSLG